MTIDQRGHLLDLIHAAVDVAEAAGCNHTAYMLSGIGLAVATGNEKPLAEFCRDPIKALGDAAETAMFGATLETLKN